MLKSFLFIVYCALIALIPLWGADYFKRKNDDKRSIICWCLFAIQSLISIGSVISYLGMA